MIKVQDLRLRIALSAFRTDLGVPVLLGYDLNEDEEMVAKAWLTEHEAYVDALVEAAQDFVRVQDVQGVDIAVIAFLSDIAVISPYLQILLRTVPMLRELVLTNIRGGDDMQLTENMRAIAAM